MARRAYMAPIRWHRPVDYVEPDERRERYEARLALEWCRANGDCHLTAPSSRAYDKRPQP